jgi:glycosyltransferase involved in cell wall biosynthesis
LGEKFVAKSVAIVTRTKNRNLLLKRAIESVLVQTYQHWVHVIVNDGGDANAVEALLNSYQRRYQGRIRVLHNAAALGMEAASNIGIRASQSDYVVIHDDDDAWHPQFLERALAAHAADTWCASRGVVTHSVLVKEKIKNERIIEVGREDYNSWMSNVEIRRLAQSNPFPPISFVFERSMLNEIGYFDESVPVLGDWDFHLRFVLHADITVLPEPLAFYHQRVEDQKTVYGNTVIAAKEQHRRYRVLLVNKYIRREIKAGRFSIGELLALGPTIERSEKMMLLGENIYRGWQSLGLLNPMRFLRKLSQRNVKKI